VTRTLHLPAAVCEDMLQHARDARPEECCGLLLGRDDEVWQSVRARNVALDPIRRFLVDPADHFAALRRGRRRCRTSASSM
jgi:proteasome lid subunit RPN8/RPN11